MDDANRKLLEADGWTVECEDPFEISDKDGSMATGRAAWMVVASLREDEAAKTRRKKR